MHFWLPVQTLFIESSAVVPNLQISYLTPSLRCVAVLGALVLPFTAAQARAEQNAQPAPAFWEGHNSSISLRAEQTIQKYREIDTQGLTPNGIFNSENGTLRGNSLQVRWQGRLQTLPVWLHASLAYATGRTAYQGYLQSGVTLTPFQAQTGNSMQQVALRLGVPIHQGILQWVPYVELAQTHWQRNLLQYGEAYRYNSQSLGLMAQWQIAPLWVLEAAIQQGRQQKSSVSVPSLGFTASQGAGSPVAAEVSLAYRFHPQASVQLQTSAQRYSNAASPVINGLQAPPSQTSHIRTSAALAWDF